VSVSEGLQDDSGGDSGSDYDYQSGERVEDVSPSTDVEVRALLTVLGVSGDDGGTGGGTSGGGAGGPESTVVRELARVLNGPLAGVGDAAWVRTCVRACVHVGPWARVRVCVHAFPRLSTATPVCARAPLSPPSPCAVVAGV
jgi:hypothetical protein